MNFPRPSLSNFVKTLLDNGNTPENLNLETLAHHNKWTDADQLLVEFKIQQNGSRKLPEEIFASRPIPQNEEDGE